ncbi:MAG TPA: J domain-containing protein [Kofleriaceae bacterium]|nr:J domain-containing protein [Kofleriaceae bacterium]
MSFTRKIFDGARSGLSSLLERIVADDSPLSYVTADALAAEVEDRIAARDKRAAQMPFDNPHAKWAAGFPGARKHRQEMAKERAARVAAARTARQRAQKKAAEAARAAGAAEAANHAHRAQQARTQQNRRPTGAGARPRTGPRRTPGFGLRHDPKLAAAYRDLNLTYGAPMTEIKSAYRKLMRRYHPDLHTQSPQKHKAATELSVQLTQAYNTLEAHFQKR